MLVRLVSWEQRMVVDPELSQRLGAKHFLSAWIGSAGPTTSAHYDVLCNVFVQIYGRKRFKLWSPASLQYMNVFPDVHPRARKTQFIDEDALPEPSLELTLHPGDALYIPSFYFHHVEALDTSISLNVFSLLREYMGATHILGTKLPISESDTSIATTMTPARAANRMAALLPLFFHSADVTVDVLTKDISKAAAGFLRTLVLPRFQRLAQNAAVDSGTDMADVQWSVDLQAMEQVLHAFRMTEAELGRTRSQTDVDGVMDILLAHLIESWALQLCGGNRPELVPEVLINTHQVLDS